MTRHVGIVWNPSKGPKRELEDALRLALEATGSNPEVTWAETEKDDPGRSAARSVLEAGADLVIAAGGDGTVRAVAEYLGETESVAQLGIVPRGTGNLLARNLSIPLNNPSKAIQLALAGNTKSIDLGWVDVEIEGETERHAFAVIAGFGIDAHMITETNDDLKEKAGWLAYVESLGRALSASESVEITLSFKDDDDDAEREIRAHTLMVGNCGTLQGGITLLPAADPTDGELDVLILGAENVGGWLDTMRNMMWDNGIMRLFGKDDTAAVSSDSTTHDRTTRVTIELSEARVFEVDGDELGETQKIAITVQPGALRVRVA